MALLAKIAEATDPSEVIITLTDDELELEWKSDYLTMVITDQTETDGYLVGTAFMGNDYTTNAPLVEREFTAVSVELMLELINNHAEGFLSRYEGE